MPYPRRRKDRAFLQLVDQVYGLIAGKTKTEAEELGAAPGEGGKTRPLPHASINAISGLLERVNEEFADRIDLYRLADELDEPLDDMLPAVEASEMLGFATVESGDLELTALGQTFAEASIPSRKEIFANRIKRVPMIRWIRNMLRAARDQSLHWNVFETALELEFPPDELERQLDTAVNWGRYAEILFFEDDILYIEEPTNGHAAVADESVKINHKL